MKTATINTLIILILLPGISSCKRFNNINQDRSTKQHRAYNGVYQDDYLNRIAFPVGGIGAGMFCIEGTGAISHMSVRNRPQVFNEPCMFAAISIKGVENGAKVLEGQVPDWKKFGQPGSGNGAAHTSYGFPRFKNAEFYTEFPFCRINLKDSDIPLEVSIKGWSPFIPGDADNSSLPVGALEYTFRNNGKNPVDAVFSYNSKNFIAPHQWVGSIKPVRNGFILSVVGDKENPHETADFAIFTNDTNTVVNHCWFRGGWFDPMTVIWNAIQNCEMNGILPVEEGAPGASLFVPLTLKPGESKTVQLMMSWYVPETNIKFGQDPKDKPKTECANKDCQKLSTFHKPWYSGKFSDITEVVDYWINNYDELRQNSEMFREAFYNSTLPPEVVEAVAANLTILKSSTVLRQTDGKLWCFEGSSDNYGCCHGSCTHVWNYAQALPHLFPSLERTLRETEFLKSQDDNGHQTFRSALPIRPVAHTFHAAADGQLGGIMKMYREWRISGDNEWMKKMYPKVRLSLDYCIKTWDPRHKGILEEPHHNTYDIEFWGPDGMCTSFYLGALQAISEMGEFLGEDVSLYKDILAKGKQFMENELYNGEYFIQKIQWEGLDAPDPVKLAETSLSINYSEEAIDLLKKEGPKYQYGNGCLSDGVLGSWMALVSGLSDPLDNNKIKSHLISVHKYNLISDLRNHANPQRPAFALGNEGGLLLCTWPKGGKLTLPFVYSNEVWTGIEYQVASHLMFMGEVQKGLDIVRACRDRYDGRIRNPFNEYECGNWYARAMSSYGLIQGLTGVRFDAVDGILYIDSRIGDFTSFLSSATGFGNVGLKNGKPLVKVLYGKIDVKKIIISGVEFKEVI